MGCQNPTKKGHQLNKSQIDNLNKSGESIFNLSSEWHSQRNETLTLADLKGKVLVTVMIYTTCKAACPRLVADMRNIEANIPKEKRQNIYFLLISIDPLNDTPEKLAKFAQDNQMTAPHWIFLQGTPESVQEFANVMSVKYKEIAPMDFSHSNIISVINPDGILVFQQEGLNVNHENTIQQILSLL